MATFTLFDSFVRDAINGTIDLDSHTFKALLSNSAPDIHNNEIKSDITEISAGNGYTAGGNTMTSVTLAETGANTGIWQWSFADSTWTASGGSIGPLRYVVVYDDTVSSPVKPLVGYLDYGSSISISSGNSFTVDVQASGVIRAQAT